MFIARYEQKGSFRGLCTINISLLRSLKRLELTSAISSRRRRNDHRLNPQQLRKVFRINRVDLAGAAHAFD